MLRSKLNETQKSFAFFVPEKTSGELSLEEVPQKLQPYFNYASTLEEPAALIAADYIDNKQIFIDECNPTCAKAVGFAHIYEVSPNYQLFNKAKSVIHRNRKGLG